MITPFRPTKHAGSAPHRLPRRRRRTAPPTKFSGTIFRLRPRLEVMEDRTLLSSFLVSNTGDSGPGSLRQAIVDSNDATGGTNTIDFDIPGSGVQTIEPLTPLPPITTSVLIDGTTQPGYAGVPLIAVTGQGTGDAVPLTVNADVTVKGLSIAGAGFSSVSSSAMLAIESVPLPEAQGGIVTYQIVVAAGGNLVATAQGVGATTSLSLLDGQGHVVVQSDGLSMAEPVDAIDSYVAPGTYSLQVQGKSGNGSFTLTTMLTPAAAPFQPIPLESPPNQILTGDFTGDGRLDLVVTDSAGIQMLLGNGDGTFQPPETVGTLGPAGFAAGFANGLAQNPSLVAGDFNGDGRLDLAAVGINTSGDGEVLAFLGNGDGTFQPGVESALGAGYYEYPVAGDFTGDGRDDLAVAGGPGFGAGEVSVLLSNGDGTFQPPHATYPVVNRPDALVTGHFSGDGHLDLAVANGYVNILGPVGPGTVSVLLGNGDGTFQPQVTYAVGIGPNTLVAGDFTGNGRDDLAVTSEQYGLQMLLSNGDGTFQPAQTVAGGEGVQGDLFAGDFRGDGKLDLGVSDGPAFSVLLGNGDGTFQPAIDYSAGSTVRWWPAISPVTAAPTWRPRTTHPLRAVTRSSSC